MCNSSGLQCCGRTLLVFKNNTNARYVGHLSVRKFSLFDGTQEEKENILHIDDQSQEGGFVSHLVVL